MPKQLSQRTKDLTLSALFAVFIALMAQLTIPSPSGVPLTLQTFGVALCGYVLGIKRGVAAIAAYIFIGAVGLPVFSAYGAGIGVLFGAAGGFLIGFIPFTLLCGLTLSFKNVMLKLSLGFAGLLVCHICGVAQFVLVYKTDFWGALLMVSLPYILKDAISVIAAFFLSRYIRKALVKIK